jgi:hypothetical protein
VKSLGSIALSTLTHLIVQSPRCRWLGSAFGAEWEQTRRRTTEGHGDVRCWHIADVPLEAQDVRFGLESRAIME